MCACCTHELTYKATKFQPNAHAFANVSITQCIYLFLFRNSCCRSDALLSWLLQRS